MKKDQIDKADDLLSFLLSHSDQLSLLVDALPVPIFYKDVAGRYLGCNIAFEQYIKLTQQQLVNHTVYELFDKEQADIYHNADQELFNNPGIQIYDCEVKSTTGEMSFVRFHKTSFLDDKGEVAGLIGIIFDITEQKLLEKKLMRQASYDDLTSLYNRREGLKQGNLLYELACRSQRDFTVLMADIDFFKRVNDQYGHLVGDEVLRECANRLKLGCRQSDIIARYGGEEFIIFLSGSNQADSILIGESLRERVANTAINVSTGDTIDIAVSIGLSHLHQQSFMELIEQADAALYQAKAGGRDLLVCY